MVWPHSPWLHTLWQESGSIAGWSVRGPVDDPTAGGDNQGTEAGSGEELARQRSLREAAGGDNQGRKLAFGAPPYSPPPLPPSPPPPLPPPPSGPWSTQGANQGKRLDPTSDELLWTGTVAGDGALRLVCGCGPALAPPYLPPPDPASSSPTFCTPPHLPSPPLTPPYSYSPSPPPIYPSPPHPSLIYPDLPSSRASRTTSSDNVAHPVLRPGESPPGLLPSPPGRRPRRPPDGACWLLPLGTRWARTRGACWRGVSLLSLCAASASASASASGRTRRGRAARRQRGRRRELTPRCSRDVARSQRRPSGASAFYRSRPPPLDLLLHRGA